MKRCLIAAMVMCAAQAARAGSTYVMPDGLNRAPAVTLHCVVSGNSVGPCGTQANPVVTSLSGSGVTALPSGGVLVSRTASISANTSTQIFAANAQRRYLALQVPLSNGIWLNPVGGTAAPNGPDCIFFSAGTFYESANFVNRGAITVYSAVAMTISAWEN